MSNNQTSDRSGHVQRLAMRWRRWRERWAPNGFADVHLDRLNGTIPWLILRWFLLPVLALPILFALGILGVAGSEGTNAAFMRVIGAFTFTMFAVTLMLPVLATWICIRALSDVKVIENRTTLQGLTSIIANWTAAGAAVSTVLGLLTFLQSRSAFRSISGGVEPFPITAFVDFPVVGAACGFTLSLIHCVIRSTSAMENRALATLLPPALLTVWVALLAAIHFTPYANGAYTVGLITAGTPVDPSKTTPPTDWKSMLAWSAHFGGPGNVLFMLPGGRVFVPMVAIVSMVWSYLANRPRNPHETTPASSSPSDAQKASTGR